jgi:FkbM family methyltransferase
LSSTYRSSRGRLFKAAIPATEEKLLIRLGTSDISVFNGMFCWREYDWDFKPPPRVIVDAGAYTGLSSVYFATRFPEARIIAIEPSKSNFDLLVHNTAAFANIEAVHAALWSHSGALVLTDPGSGAWGLQVKEADPQQTASGSSDVASEQSVPAVCMIDIIRDYHLDRIDLLKVDIEGSEKEVFANAEAWIHRVDAICMELHDRFRTGCTRTFFKAVEDFPVESWRGENVLVARRQSSFVSLTP